MRQYAAFLRGINISGKNKLNMQDLKAEFELCGFREVKTYLNSGNIVFSAEESNLRQTIEKTLADKFSLNIPVYVIPTDELKDILSRAPKWWDTGNKDCYDNLILILSSDTPEELCASIGETSEDLERIQIEGKVIFWTFNRSAYQKCSWWKRTASPGIADKLTIRTANTLKKVCGIS